jgi:osmoprotectant transport system substrate-binding protein
VLRVVLALGLLVACSDQAAVVPTTSDAVVVASFDFSESEVLGEVYAQALEQAGIRVRRELRLGPRELVLPALRQGLVDVVPEYVGTALATVTGSPAAVSTA